MNVKEAYLKTQQRLGRFFTLACFDMGDRWAFDLTHWPPFADPIIGYNGSYSIIDKKQMKLLSLLFLPLRWKFKITQYSLRFLITEKSKCYAIPN